MTSRLRFAHIVGPPALVLLLFLGASVPQDDEVSRLDAAPLPTPTPRVSDVDPTWLDTPTPDGSPGPDPVGLSAGGLGLPDAGPATGTDSTGGIAPVSLSSRDRRIPTQLLAAYEQAAERMGGELPGCRLRWELLAAIGKVESNHAGGTSIDPEGTVTPVILGPRLDGSPGRARIEDTDNGALDGDTTYDRAVGPMQFIPSTWARAGRDGNGDGNVDPNNIHDAALSAAGYLCAHGRDLSDSEQLRAAVFAYNESDAYVAVVLSWYDAYRGGSPVSVPAPVVPLEPTGSPAVTPEPTPTLEPPAGAPTEEPGLVPTVTLTPTVAPSSPPDVEQTPSVSPTPTPPATTSPSAAPTRSPTASPTTAPTVTVSPTRPPTASPTATPTRTPVPCAPVTLDTASVIARVVSRAGEPVLELVGRYTAAVPAGASQVVIRADARTASGQDLVTLNTAVPARPDGPAVLARVPLSQITGFGSRTAALTVTLTTSPPDCPDQVLATLVVSGVPLVPAPAAAAAPSVTPGPVTRTPR
ncbi:MAG: lytic murein transglycosylase [Frankia sp.]|nr:lytic murein transglycosylase [Frankia sp.]